MCWKPLQVDEYLMFESYCGSRAAGREGESRHQKGLHSRVAVREVLKTSGPTRPMMQINPDRGDDIKSQ